MQINRTRRIVGAFVTAFAALQAGISAAADWKVGDEVVTNSNAPVKLGTRTLTTIPKGTESVAKAVRGDWVAVTISEHGREISGWVEAKHLSSLGISTEAAEGRRRKMNTTTVRTLSGTTIEAAIPETIVAVDEGEQVKWDYSVTFSCRGKANATVERIGRRYVNPRGEIWTSSSGEWHSENITVPTQGGIQYSSWVSDKDLKDGTLVIGFSGRDAKGSPFEGQVTAKLVEGKSKPTSLSGVEEMPKAAVLSIRGSQRRVLANANAWRVEVVCDVPHDPQKEDDVLGLRKECEAVLKSGGFQVDDQTPTLVLRVRVFGAAKPEGYYGAGHRYTGAEVTINATIDTVGSPRETILTFSEAVGSVSPPGSISGGYETMADAPYAQACQDCRDFHTQLLSVIHAVKGAEVVYRFRSDQDIRVQGHVLPLISATGDHSFVPLLIDDLLAGNSWEVGNVATCLGTLGDDRAVEPLCMCLVDEHGNVSEPVASALAKLGDAKAIPHLRTTLLGANSKPTPVAATLGALKWRPETAKEKVVYWLALDEPNKAKEMKAEAVPVLIELLSAEKWAAAPAAQLLGELKEASAVGSLSRSLLSGNSSNPWEGRSLRLAAAKSLSEIGGPKVVEPLAMSLMSDGDQEVRVVCAAGLGKVGGEVAVKSLAQAAVADDWRVVMAAEDALGQLKARSGVDCLIKNLDHENSGVRTHAARALRLIGDAKAVSSLQTRLRTEEDDEARQAMTEALAALSNP